MHHTSHPARRLLIGWLAVLSIGSLLFVKHADRPIAAGSCAQEAAAPAGSGSRIDSSRLEHLRRLGADRWHTAGHTGRGMKIAVLDCGFRGYREQLGKGLPAKVTAKTFRLDGDFEARDSQHGILCAEVVHALAPEAELVLANWEPERPDQFLAALRWARDQGARIFTCSVIAPNWSDGEGNGPVHAELRRLLTEGDLLFFACAGNTAERHWHGPFQAGAAGCHAWRAGQIDNAVTPWGSERVAVELCAPDGSEYELSILDANAGTVIAQAKKGEAAGTMVARFQPDGSKRYQARVRHLRGAGGPFHVISLAAGLGVSGAAASIPFPGDGPEVVTIGAVNEDGKRCGYSACGPNSAKPKPDFVAPVPWVPVCRSKAFAGTSAAAPQAAALAALCWGQQPKRSAEQVRAFLQNSARDLGPAGHDRETGFGLVGLPMPATPSRPSP